MGKFISVISLMICLAFLGNGCDDEGTESMPYLTVAVDTVDFNNEEASRAVAVDANVEWHAEVAEDWVDVTGNGNSMTIHVLENTELASREARITVTGGALHDEVLVRQLGVEPAIMFSPESIEAEGEGGNDTVKIITNASWAVAAPDWVDAPQRLEATDTTFAFFVHSNMADSRRDSVIVFREETTGKTDTLRIMQHALEEYEAITPDEVLGDIQIKVARAESSANGGGSVTLSYDGSRSTSRENVHWGWVNFPATLTYYFEDVPSMNYMVYYPGPWGLAGMFGEIEIWAQCEGEDDFTKVMDYDCGRTTQSSMVTFPEPLLNPEAIQIIVKTADTGNGNLISCAEMEFYRENEENFDPLTLFTDETCSELRPGITLEEIDTCRYAFYRNIAMHMMNGTYPTEFRIQEYRAWPNPNEDAAQNKTGTYGQLDNPTGISVRQNEEIMVFVGPMNGKSISIGVQELQVSNGDGYGVTTFGLQEGMNKLRMPKSGLLYVLYKDSDYESAPKVKIHIASGEVNGYFDIEKHDAEDWDRLLDAAVNYNFDVVGKYSHLTFPVIHLRLYAGNGVDLINLYDEMVYEQQQFMGLEKYGKMFRNRMYFHVMYTSYMYATSYRTAYNVSTLSTVLDPERLKTSSWGPAHELGHIHQTRPGLRWQGMIEVTNNIHALYIQTLWGNQSRLMNADSGYANRYEKAMTNYFTSGQAHALDGDVFCRLVPFWQLYLYFDKAKGNSDFYKDVYEYVRVQPDQNGAGNQQTEFVWNCCQQAERDLTDFFEKWGFLTPVDTLIGDYGTARMTVTEERIQEIKDLASRYPKPDAAFEYITDANVELFKQMAPVSAGTAQVSGTSVEITGGSNAVAYEACNAEGKLIRVSTETSFTLPEEWQDGFRLYAVGANGEKAEITVSGQ